MSLLNLIDIPLLERFLNNLVPLFNAKYDKTGGDISGNVKVFGNFTLDIDDPDYDSGIRFTKALDTNAGTVLTLTGYANGAENTNYKTVIRNVADPINNYDVATKHYVDSVVVRPLSYIVILNNDGTIDQYSSSISYNDVKSVLNAGNTNVYLDVIYQTSRVHIPAVQDQDTNNGPIVFMGELRMSDGNIAEMVFLLSTSNVLTNNITLRENALLKTGDIATYSNSQYYYPTTKAVWDMFQRKPVVVWETSGTGLTALETNMSDNPSWQLTNLDMTPFKRIKIFTKAAQKSGTTASASTTAAMVLEMSLDSRAAGPYGGHYIGSMMSQKPNDRNRIATLTCAVSADKTSFAVMRMTNLYGTGATDNSDVGGYVFKIEGYYD